MAQKLDDTGADLRRKVAELEQRLMECRADGDKPREQQSATAEVLSVINSSPGDLAPVFDAILDKAMNLCEAAFGTLRTTPDGEHFDLAALRRVPPALAEYLEHDPPTIGSGRGPARILEGEQVVHVLDAADDEAYRSGPPGRRALVDLGGARTVLSVGKGKENAVLGGFTIYSAEGPPFPRGSPARIPRCRFAREPRTDCGQPLHANIGLYGSRPSGFPQCGRACRHPNGVVCAAAQRQLLPWTHLRSPPGSAPLHRQADLALAEFCGSGGCRDGKCASHHRNSRGPGTADRH